MTPRNVVGYVCPHCGRRTFGVLNGRTVKCEHADCGQRHKWNETYYVERGSTEGEDDIESFEAPYRRPRRPKT